KRMIEIKISALNLKLINLRLSLKITIFSSFEMTALPTTKHLQTPFAQMLLAFPFCQLTPC
ncbi:hypothetical protein, partial [Vibrio cholerae]|uniref:hypothetical protein n=1 Tax=Vibrio cholerae TaxID=666 RepID=UPI001E3D291E